MAGFRGEIAGDKELGRLIMSLGNQDIMSFSCGAKPQELCKMNERTGNVYENKGEGSRSSKVEESNARGEPSGHPGLGRELLDSQLSTPRLRKMNEPGMSMKTKDRVEKPATNLECL
jgi:hypothetical protein